MLRTPTLILALALAATFSLAQTPLRIRLIDGKNGKPLTPTTIRVQPTPAEQPRYLIPAADPASVLVYLKSATTFTVTDQFKSCATPKPTDPQPQFSVPDILDHGAVTPNTCGKFQAAPKKGELVLYVRHATPCEETKEHVTGVNFCN